MNITQNWNSEFIKNTIFIDRHSLSNVVEIGCYEALTSNYIVDNLLASNGHLICIDPLSDDYELDSRIGDNEIFRGQFQRFTENSEHNKDRITLIRKKSEEASPHLRSNHFDLCFVDGHHAYREVLIDGQEAFRITKDYGYILFDDYLWNSSTFPVKQAVDQLLEENKNYKLLLKLNQVLIQKLPEGSATEDGQNRYQELCIEKLFAPDKIYAAYTNLDSRTDRRELMEAELKRIDLEIPIVRQRSYPWQELWDNFSDEEKEKCMVMKNRTAGAIGCHFSQVEIMKEAMRQGRHAWVNEDDLQFCSDMPTRLKIIFKFLNQHEWDIFWMGGTYHKEPTWHKSIEGIHTHPEMKGYCNCLLNRDWEETLDGSIVKTYGAFSTHSYLVNKNRIEHILGLLDRNLHLSMGIDWIMLKEQPNLNTYAFNPGCVKQFDSMSDISNAFAKQSGFKNLGKHWWANSMNEV